MSKQTKTKTESKEVTNHISNSVLTRGRFFEGTVKKKFLNRAVIEFERTVKVQKYERFYKKRSKMHARIPNGMKINVGDYIRIQECRPLSKIIHAIVVEKIRSADNSEVKK